MSHISIEELPFLTDLNHEEAKIVKGGFLREDTSESEDQDEGDTGHAPTYGQTIVAMQRPE